MRFFHLADLHLGKMMHGVSMLENGDQEHFVRRFLEIAGREKPDAVVIAGDVYDRSMPAGDAMQLLSTLVTGLSDMGVPVLICAGNHDSGERLSCFSGILARSGVYISGIHGKELTHVTLRDEWGPVTFWLMPYLFPAAASVVLEDDTIRDYDTAVRRLLAAQDINKTERNVIVAHQNVVAGGKEGMRGGSESVVGGVGQVDYTAFDDFEYAALGHIHAAYPVGRESVRYAGSPLCYHFDEIRQAKKGPVLVTLGEKGTEPETELHEIAPLHPLREFRGTDADVRKLAEESGSGEYVKIVLTDTAITPEISSYYQSFFEKRGSILMERVSEFRRFGDAGAGPARRELEKKPVWELFADFYSARRGGESPGEGELDLMRYAAGLLEHSDSGADGKYVDPKLFGKMLDYLDGKEA